MCSVEWVLHVNLKWGVVKSVWLNLMSTCIFSWDKGKWKIRETDLIEILLHSIPNGCSRQVYVQGFYFESVNFKKDTNMF